MKPSWFWLKPRTTMRVDHSYEPNGSADWIDTRQFLDRLERAGAGRQIVDLFRGDLLLLARDAAGEDHDLLELRGVGGGGDGRLLGDLGGAEHRRRDEHG